MSSYHLIPTIAVENVDILTSIGCWYHLSEIDRVIGAIIIVIGLYSLIWGKSKDRLTQPSESDENEGALKLPIAAADAIKSNSVGHATVVEIS